MELDTKPYSPPLDKQIALGEHMQALLVAEGT